MTESISCVIPEVTVHNNRPVTTSIAVANFFGKQHKDVLRKIRMLECSPAFTTAHFCAVAITTQAGFDDREIEAFEMTKNGFIFLVMGFTGKKAAAFKEAYIAEFDRMEAELAKRTQPPAPAFSPAKSVQIAPPGRYQLLLTMDGVQVVSSEVVSPRQLLVFFDDIPEIARRAGYVVMRRNELDKISVSDFFSLAITK